MKSQLIVFIFINLGICSYGQLDLECEEYKFTVFEEVLPLSLIGGSKKKLSVDKCVRNIVATITGSNEPEPKEFPHMALIGFDSDKEIKWLCSGTLISDEYVLTAAQCAYSRVNGKPNYAHLGYINFNNGENSNSDDSNISTIILHPKYKSSSYNNYIALLKLNRKLELNSYKRPACLPTQFDYGGSKAVSTGRDRNLSSKNSPPHLRKIVLDIFSSSKCNATYSRYIGQGLEQGIIADTQICAGLRHQVNDNGHGDFGGPLQIYYADQYCIYEYTIIGITSFGVSSSYFKNFPDVFTRVYPYLDWIENIVWKNDS